jgi:putative holliday junction resolvase
MQRIMAIDWGAKRVGLAVTDPLQIIASALTTLEEPKLFSFLTSYFAKEPVKIVLLGYPTQDDGSDTHSTAQIRGFAEKFRVTFPDKELIFRDEAFTSKQAMQAMVHAGVKKKQRREKGNLDKLSATLILQEYLGH